MESTKIEKYRRFSIVIIVLIAVAAFAYGSHIDQSYYLYLGGLLLFIALFGNELVTQSTIRAINRECREEENELLYEQEKFDEMLSRSRSRMRKLRDTDINGTG